jgi:hypothetical protein
MSTLVYVYFFSQLKTTRVRYCYSRCKYWNTNFRKISWRSPHIDICSNGSTRQQKKKTMEHWKKKKFLIYREIQTGAVAKSYMRRGFLIYEEMRKYLVILRRPLVILWLCNRSRLNLLIYDENLIYCFFIVVAAFCPAQTTFGTAFTAAISRTSFHII